MAGTVTKYNSDNRAIERDPVLLVFEYEGELGLTKSEEAVLRAMPANCIYLSAEIQCITAEAGATSSLLSLKHGSTAVLTGKADNGGAVGKVDNGAVVASNGTAVPQADTSAAANLVASYTSVGTSTTAPKWRILLWVMRPDF